MTEFAQQFKERQRKTWTVGDYPEIAKMIEACSDLVVEKVGVSSGEKLLDVATGSGNAALAAARKGAEVTGLDLTPKLLDVARERAAAEGLEIKFMEGDAEDLPFDNGSFDRVTSVFGVMFAPRHAVGAAELVRVAAPGGTIAFAAWTPEGGNGQMFKTVGSYMPPPPPEFVPPVMWGNEDYVTKLFADQPVELEFERHTVALEGDSVEAFLAKGELELGPVVMAKAALEPEGKWEDLRADLKALYEGANVAGNGGFKFEPEYLLTIARVAA
jgi:SAM-dependent methyltransferase